MDLVWATRGRDWGFRFLLDGGFPDPLPAYESAFSGVEGESAVYRHAGPQVALRFPDPLDRRDAASRVITHDFVLLSPLADEVDSVEEGVLKVWPLVADVYADVWDQLQPPSGTHIRTALGFAAPGREEVPEIGSATGSDHAGGIAGPVYRMVKPTNLGFAMAGLATIVLTTWVACRAISSHSRPGQSTLE